MRRVALLCSLFLTAAIVVGSGAFADGKRTYRVEFDNAFGIVQGSQVKVAGVESGVVSDIDINGNKRAVISFTADLKGFDDFRTDATCASNPQSLIAEYFVDCQPGTKGEALEENGLIPVEQTTTNVQPDLANNIMRLPFNQAFSLIIAEFGTGLAGRSEDLSAAIRRGAPALRETAKVVNLLAKENKTLERLQVDSDRILTALVRNKKDVSRFIREAGDTAQAGADRREDLRAQFDLLPDFLEEYTPTMARLGELARAQTPLLRDLDRASDDLVELTQRVPGFADASTTSLKSLGDTGEVAIPVLRKSRDEIAALRKATKNLKFTSRELALFLKDLDDPKRAVYDDPRVKQQTTRSSGGFTGFENFINYFYYQTLGINQFDEVGYMLRIILSEVGGQCGSYSSEPAQGGDARCVSWLGDNQPGVNQDDNLPPYDPSVCPNGSERPDLCRPSGGSAKSSKKDKESDEPTHDGASRQSVSADDKDADKAAGAEMPKALSKMFDLSGDDAKDDEAEKSKAGNRPVADKKADKNDKSTDPSTTNDLLEFLFAN